MLQIDHIYEFLYKHVFNEFDFYHLFVGSDRLFTSIPDNDIAVFNAPLSNGKKIFFYDSEPILDGLAPAYYKCFSRDNVNCSVFATSEKSQLVDDLAKQYNFIPMYYFYHGFAALDWYRGFYALNYNNTIVRKYNTDYTCFNRIIQGDRAYRNYLIAQLNANNLLDKGAVSYNVVHNQTWSWEQEIDSNTKLSNNAIKFIKEQNLPNKIIADDELVPGYASADIPRQHDSFWHVVPETVFYYDKLHLTEKIFKPIVSKQPFMLVAAPGNLAYLKSYGFKTFDNVIDESYDNIQDPDERVDAIVSQLEWYCSLNAADKLAVAREVEDAVKHNFEWFYTGFKHQIAQELVDNVQEVYEKVDYCKNLDNVYKVLTK